MHAFRVAHTVLAVLIAGCGSGLPATRPANTVAPSLQALSVAPGEGPWYPVDLGRRWTYRTLFRHGGTPEREGAPHVFAITAEDRDGVRLERRYGQTQALPSRIRVSDHEVRAMRWLEGDPRPEASVVLMQLPVVPGARWSGRPLAGGASETIMCMGFETVTHEGGTWQAVRVAHVVRRPGMPDDESLYWYARGIGMVRGIERLTILVGQEPRLLEAELRLVAMESTP
ncbi:MAG: hypothetical protein VKP57_02420 [Candidatus Sericytochromatia bacterium]|nr:hypothetical protein [Candidatus Sericytochromatia bacterium]